MNQSIALATSTGNVLLDWARWYASLGWRVLPLHSFGERGCSCGVVDCPFPAEHPRVPVADATTDEATLRQWWTGWPESNIAVATGAASGIIVLVIDEWQAGTLFLQQFYKRHGTLPHTAQSSMPCGPEQHFFQHPRNEWIRNRSALGKVEGVDLRADGGLVVMPPSWRPIGCGHERWKIRPDAAPIAELQPRLLRLATKLDFESGYATAGPEAIPIGQRTWTLSWMARSRYMAGHDLAAILATLRQVNTERCLPALPDYEVEALVRNVFFHADDIDTARVDFVPDEA